MASYRCHSGQDLSKGKISHVLYLCARVFRHMNLNSNSSPALYETQPFPLSLAVLNIPQRLTVIM